MPRMKNEDRAALVIRKEQLEARIKDHDAREKIRRRKADTRMKIIYGALAMEHAATNPESEFAAIMLRLLNRYVVLPADRKLLGLLEREVDTTSCLNSANIGTGKKENAQSNAAESEEPLARHG